jgi:hypothetical protein
VRAASAPNRTEPNRTEDISDVNDISPAGERPGDDERPDELATLGALAGALSSDGLDVAALSRILTGALVDALPPGMVEVERDRSLSDRMAGRPGTVAKLTVRAGERLLTLNRGRGGATEAYIGHEVRGVTISRSPVPITEWVMALARELRARADSDLAARAALQRLLLG